MKALLNVTNFGSHMWKRNCSHFFLVIVIMKLLVFDCKFNFLRVRCLANCSFGLPRFRNLLHNDPTTYLSAVWRRMFEETERGRIDAFLYEGDSKFDLITS